MEEGTSIIGDVKVADAGGSSSYILVLFLYSVLVTMRSLKELTPITHPTLFLHKAWLLTQRTPVSPPSLNMKFNLCLEMHYFLNILVLMNESIILMWNCMSGRQLVVSRLPTCSVVIISKP